MIEQIRRSTAFATIDPPMRRLAGVALVAVVGCTPFAAGQTSMPDDVDASTDAAAKDNTPDASRPSVDGGGDVDAGPGTDYAIHLGGDAYADVAGLAIPQNFTLEAWIHPVANDLAREQDIFAKDRSGAGGIQCRLVLRDDNSLYFNAADAQGLSHGFSDGSFNRQLTSPPIDLDVWTHVAVTKQGVTTALLVNGKIVKQIALDTDFVIPPVADVNFRIGARYAANGNGADSTFLGAIDDVRIWNFARTEAEIQSTMHSAPASLEGLVASYAFPEGTGTSSQSVPASYPATLVGATWIPR